MFEFPKRNARAPDDLVEPVPDDADHCANADASAEPLKPNAAAIRAHIEWLTSPALERYGDALLEIAWDRAGDGNPNRAQLFPITEAGVIEAAKVAARVNENAEDCHCNVFLGMMLKKPGTRSTGRTKARDCYVGTAIPCDIDVDADTTNAALEEVAKPGLTVRTGATPQPRFQRWCRLTEPCDNPNLVEEAFEAFVRHVGADTDARGAYRLMRLAGSVSYPSAKKQARSYIIEQTTLNIDVDAPPVDIHTFINLPPKDSPNQKKAKGERPTTGEAASGKVVNISSEDFTAAVMSIPNTDEAGHDRDTWLRVGMAIRHQLGDTGPALALFDEWSRAHSSYDEAETKTAWQSFAKPHNGKPVTALSILKMARENGWRPSGKTKRDAQNETGGYVSFDDFEMSENGLWKLPPPDSKLEPVRISDPFKILGLCRDAQNSEWGKLIEFFDPDGNIKQLHVANADLQRDIGVVLAELACLGLTINPACGKQLAVYLANVTINRRVRTVERTGWHGGVFVLPAETIGANGDEPTILIDPGAHGYAQMGTLEDWQAGVAKLAAPHRLARLAISTALSGSLLNLVNGESGGLHFPGNSSTGKTTLLSTAATVWGRGTAKDGFIKSWNTTANAVEGMAAASTDTCLVLDELGQARAEDVGGIIYAIGNDRGKERMRADTTMRAPKTWRVAVLSSGEKTIEQKISEGYGTKATAGVEMRLLNISADAGCGYGVFDSLAGFGDGNALVTALRKACAKDYGVAGPAFVRAIVQRGVEEVTAQTSKMVAAFVEKHLSGNAAGQAWRVARRLGLLAAAGELAIEFNILPWPQGYAEEAAAWALSRWVEQNGGDAVIIEDKQALDHIRELIEQFGDSRFDNLEIDERTPKGTPIPGEDLDAMQFPNDEPDYRQDDARPTFTRYGFRRGCGDTREWIVFPETFRTVFCKGCDPKRIAELLAKLGKLRKSGKNFVGHRKVNNKDYYGYVLAPTILDKDTVEM